MGKSIKIFNLQKNAAIEKKIFNNFIIENTQQNAIFKGFSCKSVVKYFHVVFQKRNSKIQFQKNANN